MPNSLETLTTYSIPSRSSRDLLVTASARNVGFANSQPAGKEFPLDKAPRNIRGYSHELLMRRIHPERRKEGVPNKRKENRSISRMSRSLCASKDQRGIDGIAVGSTSHGVKLRAPLCHSLTTRKVFKSRWGGGGPRSSPTQRCLHNTQHILLSLLSTIDKNVLPKLRQCQLRLPRSGPLGLQSIPILGQTVGR